MVSTEESHESSTSKAMGRKEGVERAKLGAEYHESSPAVISRDARRSSKGDCTVNIEMLPNDDHVMRPKLRAPVPITVKFEDVCFSVNLKPQTTWWDFKSLGRKMSKHADEKVVLNNILGLVKPGEMLAMLGPSGSGKTSLLNVLGGRAKGTLTGTILFNGLPYNKEIKRRTGFVTQDDVLYAHLTVKETLVYAAILRLPREFTRQDKIHRAEEVITELGLEKCQDTMIGGPFLRGVSGGERKRVCIGNEMLIDPSLLALDEPTSGLDSTIALKIIQTLQELAKGGRTIITTIHQPSSIIFHTFDKLLLLSEGHTLYFGPRSEIMGYFNSVGFRPSYETNPADFLLDLANGVQHDIDPLDGTPSFNSNKGINDSGHSEDIRKNLREFYESKLLLRNRTNLARALSISAEDLQGSQKKSKWTTSWFEQLSVLIVRSMKEKRHEIFSGLRILQVLTISIVCGLLWWQSPTDNIQDKVGLIFFLTTFWGLYPIFSSIFTFPTERQMLAKERASGMYRLSAYFCARNLGDLPLELILPILSLTMVYWMAGMKPTAAAFFYTVLSILLTVLVSQGLGLLLGAALMDVQKATTFAAVIMLTFQLVGGFFVQEIPAFIGWLKYLSLTYYSFKLQLGAQFTKTETYNCEAGQCLVVDYPAVKQVGIDNLGVAVMALLIMLVGYRVLAYISLMNMKV